MFQCDVKVLSLVRGVTQRFLLFGLSLGTRRFVYDHGFRGRGRLGGVGRLGDLGLGCPVGCSLEHAVGVVHGVLAGHHVDAEGDGEYLHHARVGHVGPELVRIFLDVGEHRDEVGLGEEAARGGVRGELAVELGGGEHGADGSHGIAARARGAHRAHRRGLRVGEARFTRVVCAIDLEPFVVGVARVVVALEAVERGALARVPLHPVRLDRHGLLGVGQRGVVVVQRGVRRGPVAVEDVVGGVHSDGIREVLHRVGVVARAERGVAQSLFHMGGGCDVNVSVIGVNAELTRRGWERRDGSLV